MTSKHTPTPWRITKRRSRKIVSTGGISIASVVLKNTGNVNAKTNQKSESEAQANADFIITAVNAYEDNQATIKALTEALEPFAGAYVKASYMTPKGILGVSMTDCYLPNSADYKRAYETLEKGLSQ